MNKFLAADLHFGHEREAKRRGFASLEEHDYTLMKNWNDNVNPKDIIYVVGDFAWNREALEKYGARLNGDKRLIQGNHDQYPSDVYLRYFSKLHGSLPIGRHILSHIPVHPMDLETRFVCCIHGHTHSAKVMQREVIEGCRNGTRYIESVDHRYICVSVDQWNFTPVRFEIIMEKANALALRNT